ncbi:MAG: endonuclease domain-containing protein [Bacteroidota bacterium]
MLKRKIIPYNKNLKILARNLRNHSTLSEVLLWQQLKGKQLCGYDFHRQKPIDKYIIDFYCSELSLAIEIDGRSHDEKYDEDVARQQRLESLGVHLLRFTDRDVKHNLAGVVTAIEEWINTHAPDTPL